MNNQVVVIFTRTPQSGKVKTRLQPELTPEQALACHMLLLENTLQRIQAHEYRIELWSYPDTQHPLFEKLQQRFSISIHRQSGGDLGERMFHCLDFHIKQGNKIVLIGSDCPDINTAYIAEAFTQLHDNDVVLGPASDGGYVLISARKISKAVFEGIEWGSDRVYRQTVTQLNHSDLSHNSLDMLNDIDSYEDLKRYPELLRQIQSRSSQYI
jgi:rSAM/selenodomain-associated transferase 1